MVQAPPAPLVDGRRDRYHRLNTIRLGKETGGMALYVILSNLTDHGRKTIKARPERIREVNDEISQMGGKVLAQYATLGPYDFVNIVEAANNEVITRISVELGARGTLQLLTLPAIKIDEFISRISP
jgi:uncharacterized protein with GYD domain